jgi:hypothetical protein
MIAVATISVVTALRLTGASTNSRRALDVAAILSTLGEA